MKSIENIIVPPEWEISDDWSSHRPALYLSVKNKVGSVVELGCGSGSTDLLRDYCKEAGRPFISFDSDIEYAQKYKALFVEDWEKEYIWRTPCSICFIDMKPGEYRKEAIKIMSELVNVLAVHDSEAAADYVYGMSKVLDSFKYRLNFEPKGYPHTAIISNQTNVESWI